MLDAIEFLLPSAVVMPLVFYTLVLIAVTAFYVGTYVCDTWVVVGTRFLCGDAT